MTTAGDVIDQDGQRQVWKAHYWQHHVEEWKEFSSPEDAIAFLSYGEGSRSLSSRGVVWPDGSEREYDWVNDAYGRKMLGRDV